MKNMKTKRLVCGTLIGLNLLFIWGNSILPGSASGEISGGLMVFLEQLLGDAMVIGEFLLRKLGHFSEFCLLGILLSWLFLLLGEKGSHRITSPLVFGVLAALTDETIQVFVPQRGPSVIDVWIDTAGVTLGILLLLLGHTVIKKKNSENHMEEI